ncbi:MAG: endonuclease [Bacteroidota bacterium]
MNPPLPLRLTVFVFSFCVSLHLFAQTPPPGLSGPSLRSWLKTNFYTGKHSNLGYSTARARMYGHIDNVNNTIICVYGGYTHPWNQGSTGTNPAPVNTEHTVPQAWYPSSSPIRSDLHHIFPTYDQWNSQRASDPFGEIPDNQTTIWMRLTNSQSNTPSSNIDEYSESNGGTFEPREDHKGDCARAIFYIFTMYSLTSHDIHDMGDINTLYQWHQQDPPSTKETARNHDIESWQGNRNPYVDHPEWVGPAWGFGVPAPTAPQNVQVIPDTAQLTLSWDDVADETAYYLYRSTDNNSFALYDSVGMNSTSYTDTEVIGGVTYYYYVVAYNDVGNSPNSSTASGTPYPGMGSGGYASELLISEYIEGTLFNKALEIANGTGTAVQLDAYSLKKQINGSGNWTDELMLSGLLADGDVWVIASSAADGVIQAQVDLSSNSNLMVFNGNDPIGLFKHDSLIDAVGAFNGGSANFGKDVSLVRKSMVLDPNSMYDTAEWEVYPTNHFDKLGMHTFEPDATPLSTQLNASHSIQIWPNPVTSTFTLSITSSRPSQARASLYDSKGRRLQDVRLPRQLIQGEHQHALSLDQVSSGLYLLHVSVGREQFVKKIWKR